MIHLEVRNQPPALKGKELTHRITECIAVEYNHMTNEIAIYEDFKQWVDHTPGYTIMYVVSVTCFGDDDFNFNFGVCKAMHNEVSTSLECEQCSIKDICFESED